MFKAHSVGKSILKRSSRWKAIQTKLGLKADGWPGDLFLSEMEKRLGILKLTKASKPADKPLNITSFPHPDARSMGRFYGKAGDESNLVRIKFPYEMKLYTRKGLVIKSHRVHKKCAASLLAILTEILDTLGMAYIQKHGLDVFGGIFNYRKTRGGSSLSKHAYGAAIDLNPSENRNRQKWSASKIGQSGWANMPLAVITIFEKHGWKSGARAWGRDAMHFQATK